MTGSYLLTGPQTVQSNSNGWVENYFDLRAEAVSMATNIKQDFNTSTTTPSAGAGSDMNWTARGLLLPPRLTGATAEGIEHYKLMVDTSSTTDIYTTTSSTAEVELDSNVIIVPVVVQELFDDVASSSSWYPQIKGSELLDNSWVISRDVASNPTANPQDVQSTWLFRGTQDGAVISQAREPDSIWTQCDIQFRLVQYTTCKVPADAWQNSGKDSNGNNSPTIACDADAFVNRVANAADSAACLKDSNIPGTLRLILSGPYQNAAVGGQCADGTVMGETAPNQDNVFVSILGMSTFNVVAHEFGHALGLFHNTIDPDSLMTPLAGAQTKLSTSECTAARTRALSLQNAFQSWQK